MSRPVQFLKTVGPRRAERFARLRVLTALDLLYHVPRRYEDATTVARISSLEPGDEATIIGRVVSTGVIRARRGLRVFHAVLRDATGQIECAWPGRPWLERTVRKGQLLLVTGPVRFYHGRQMQPREHTLLEEGDEAGEPADSEPAAGRVFPIYPATEGLSHRQIRAIIRVNLPTLLREVESREPFDPGWRSELGIPPLRKALETLHDPAALEDVEPARRRLAYEELFYLQLLHARARHRQKTDAVGISHSGERRLSEPFLRGLPFRLTRAQERAWREIEADMERDVRMYRLLQGDVASGKTVIAAAAMLKAIENDRQAVLMAPTELLAEQHFRTLTGLMEAVGVEPEILTGSLSVRERQRALERLASGEARAIVGTHALIQADVRFAAPGVVVIDEQHRFGVEQRRLLREAGERTDTLVMSATPIPRSLALTLYGDLDLSVLDEMPPGRTPVTTGVRGPESREAAFQFLESQLREGRQGYIVYPLIDESEVLDLRAATEMHERLSERFAGFEVGLLHGRLSGAEREDVMRRYLAGEIQLLVSTTVIEVGIDVPNATVMYIEDAERFGLAQLHQLRGRVGRGTYQGYCAAFYSGKEPPERLEAFARTTDGFELARADLRLRGQGNLFGERQHGVPEFRFAELERDSDLLEHAWRKARKLVASDPKLERPEHRQFARDLVERYGRSEALYEVG
ncbi:MAG: ATP-dependent DNA helicase RecG [Gemmatimonadetes bacterium]|nr:ATP-dependent DNA helicase RecG [Gemmatimonadota bacterium]